MNRVCYYKQRGIAERRNQVFLEPHKKRKPQMILALGLIVVEEVILEVRLPPEIAGQALDAVGKHVRAVRGPPLRVARGVERYKVPFEKQIL
jgi:hypothetical protein